MRKLVFLSVLFLGTFAWNNVQSYPDGLDLVNPIRGDSGSDYRGVAYNSFYTTTIAPYVSSNLSGEFFNPPASTTLPPTTLLTDPNSLQISTLSNVRVYFIESTAGYRNAFGWDPNHDFTLSPGEKSIIFPNAHTLASSSNPGDPNSPYPALVPGDFVELPQMAAGTYLDFFLLANGANSASYDTWWSQTSENSDNASHVKTVHFDGTPYYLMGWEDLPNLGDGDFSDVFLVVEIIPAPEPATYLLLATMLLAVAGWKKPQRATSKLLLK